MEATALTSPSTEQGFDQIRSEADKTIKTLSTTPVSLLDFKQAFLARDALSNTNDHTHVSAGGDVSIVWDASNPGAEETEAEWLKDHFRKLKFTFIEQETKERFFRHISDEDSIRHVKDQAELDAKAEDMKAELKQEKATVADLKGQICALADELGPRYEALASQTTEAAFLLQSIQDVELELGRMRALHPAQQRLTVDEATAKLDEQIVELQSLDSSLVSRQSDLSLLRRELAQQSRRLDKLNAQRSSAEALAAEVVRRSRKGEREERERDRWTVELECLKLSLGLARVSAKGREELTIVWRLPAADQDDNDDDDDDATATLKIRFDSASQALKDAELRIPSTATTTTPLDAILAHAGPANDVCALVQEVQGLIAEPLRLGVPAGR